MKTFVEVVIKGWFNVIGLLLVYVDLRLHKT